MSIPPPAVQPGEVVAGKYRIDRVLGEGGMGIVVAATHLQLEQRVALKVLLPSLVSNAEVVRRFIREARAAVKIQSEHVARVLDVGTTDAGMPYMVMEYLDGQDLERVLGDRELTSEDCVGYILQACEAIAEAHAHGIVHRDLKPSNLFLARRPGGKSIIKVLDFGISKAPATARDGAATSANALMGSPLYMSPEQMISPNTVDVRTDVWCLGVVLYELLSQRVPFSADTMPQLVFVVVQQPHPPLRSIRPDIPEGLSAVVDRCLAKKQEDRFQNVAELARALVPYGPPRSDVSVERIEQVLGMAAAEPQPAGPGGVLPRRPEGMTFVPTTSQAMPGRSRRVMVPVALVALAAVGVGGALVLRRPAARAAASASPPAVVAPVATAPAPVAPSSAPAAADSVVVLAAPSTTSAPAPSASVPWWYGKPGEGHPHASARPATSVAPAGPVSTCHVVSFFDADGNKHFKQECP